LSIRNRIICGQDFSHKRKVISSPSSIRRNTDLRTCGFKSFPSLSRKRLSGWNHTSIFKIVRRIAWRSRWTRDKINHITGRKSIRYFINNYGSNNYRCNKRWRQIQGNMRLNRLRRMRDFIELNISPNDNTLSRCIKQPIRLRILTITKKNAFMWLRF